MSSVAIAEVPQKLSLVRKFASKYNLEESKLLTTLKATAFRQRDNAEITNEQMAALLIVADQYDLNPFTKEIFAFADKNGIVPVVSVDGWASMVNRHPACDGIEFRQSEDMTVPDGGKNSPEWIECILYRKDRSHPIVVREYLDECYRAPFFGKKGTPQEYRIDGPWQTHTKRMLRHKALIQSARLAFSFAGVYDEDEAARIIEGQSARVEDTVLVTPPVQSATERAKAAAKAAQATRTVAEAPEAEKTPQTAQNEAAVAESGAAADAPEAGEPVEVTANGLLAEIVAAKSKDAVELIMDRIRYLPAPQQVAITSAAKSRIRQLEGGE